MPTITGTPNDDMLTGTATADTIYGLGGNDTIDGADGDDLIDGGTGNDAMFGGLGDDTFLVDDVNDLVLEEQGRGRDSVYATVNYTLGSGQEIEILSTGSQAGTGAFTLVGNEFNQIIYGNGGANYLDGAGGNDTLVGFGGDDIYVVDDLNDTVVESSFGGGEDTVYVRGSFALSANQYVETIAAFSLAGTAPILIVGNEGTQRIFGNAGANYLDSGGGQDRLFGLGGDDTYVVGDLDPFNSRESVFEAAGGGYDVVYARESFTLTAGQEIEALAAFSQAAATSMNLIGNGLNQSIYGNAGFNFIDGGGGSDVLVGFGGNDDYLVDSLGDYVAEATGAGFDEVFSKASYTLPTGQEIELLTAASQNTSTAMDLIGNEFSQQILANMGDNIIDGRGGNDFLLGLSGADTFRFTAALGPGNVDVISDFSHNIDKIALDDAVFGGIGPLGALNPNAFVVGAAAQDADDRIIYDSANASLYFDADGNGAGAQILFATVQSNPALTASDFLVI